MMGTIQLRVPQKNDRLAYGYEYEYDTENGNTLRIIPLNEYGDSIAGRSLRFTTFDHYYRWTEAGSSTAQYSKNYMIYTMTDRTDTLRYNDDGLQIYRSELVKGSFFRTFAYDAFGNLTEKCFFRCIPTGGLELRNKLTCTYLQDDHSLLERTEYNADAVVKYHKEVHEKNDSVTSITYYGGNNLGSLTPMNSESEGYHQQTTIIRHISDGTELLRTYRSIDTHTGQSCIIRQEKKIYNADSILWRNIVTDSLGHRTLSLEYEIENGIIVGQHVLGLSGNIIRYPLWDDNQLCYYRKKFIRNFAGDIVAAKAINEFGEESLITYGTHEIKTSVVPGDEIQQDGDNYTIYGTGSYKFSASDVNQNYVADYLHITDTLGTYYQCGLRDGDIILSMSPSEVRVARPATLSPQPQASDLYYSIHVFYPHQGNDGMEHYPVYFTEAEMRHLKQSIVPKP